jgi:assimilatory nitrate reductase catalytic subunit
VLHHYLSGAQTRRIPAQVAVSPAPVLELHPETAIACGLIEGELALMTSAVGEVSVAWTTNPKLRKDTLFLPYHWPVANRLTAADQLDPTSRIPNFKVIPVDVRPVTAMFRGDQCASRASVSRVTRGLHAVAIRPNRATH